MIAVTTDILLGALIVALHKTSCFGRNVTLEEHGTQGREKSDERVLLERRG